MTVEIVWQRVESFCAFPIFVWEFLPTFCFGHRLEIRRVLNFLTFPSNIAFEEFFLGSLRASPLPKPLLNACWVTAVGVWHWNVSVQGLKCVRTSRIRSFSNHSSFVEEVKGVLRDTGLSAFNFVKGENTKWKFVNREWLFACRDTLTLNFFMRYSWLSTIFFSWKRSFSWKQILQWSQWTFKWTFLKV